MKEYQQHELSAAFPAMSNTEFESLCEDIRLNGQRPGCDVVLFEGKVLDGWHRYGACQTVGRVPRVVNLPDGADPVEFVESMNLHRRHLSGSQRAAAVVACREWRNAGRPKAELGAGLNLTNKELAEKAEVSERTIRHAKTAQQSGLGEAVRNGDMSAREAAEVANPPKPKTSPVIPAEPSTYSDPLPVEENPALPGKEYEIPAGMILVPSEEWASLIADNEDMGKIIDADDHLKAARNEQIKWKRKHDALEIRFKGQTSELNECKKAVKRLQGVVKKLEAQVPKSDRVPGEEG